MSDPVLYLLLSLVALAVGPLVVKLATRARAAIAALDAFVLVVVGGLVLLHVLPHTIQLGGSAAVAAVIVGLVLPMLAERGLRPDASGVRGTAILLAMAGMFVHAMLDGLALLGDGHDHAGHDHVGHSHGPGGGHDDSSALVWAVIAHRLPVGIGIWWIVGRTLGVRVAVSILTITAVGTLVGFFAGDRLLTDSSEFWAGGVFQALVGGSLLHVLLHAHVPAPDGGSQRVRRSASVVGALLAVVVVWLVERGHSHGPVGAGTTGTPGEVFLELLLESAPVLVVAYLVAGLAQVFMPTGWVGWVNRGSPLRQAVRGIAVGLPLPVCSCGVVPIYRSLVARGTATAAAIGFLIATPELEVAAVLMTFQLMGPEIGAARLGAAAILALVVGVAVHAIQRTPNPVGSDGGGEEDEIGSTEPLGVRLRAALRVGVVDMVDQTAPWILVGLGVSAMLAPHLDPETLAALPVGIDVPCAALLGLPIYVCASGSTPLAAVFVAQGLSPGAAIAFLLTGPATNLTTFGVIDGTQGRRAAVGFAIASLVGAVGIGYFVNLLVPASAVDALQLSAHEHGPGSVMAWIAVAALAGLMLCSMLRRGVRGFMESLFTTPIGEAGAETAGHANQQHGCH